MEPKGSLPHSQVSVTYPYPEPDQSSPYPPHPTSWRSILILSSHLRLGLPQISPPKPWIRLSDPPYALHALPIPFFSILSPEKILVGNRSFSTSLCSLLHSSVTSSLLGPNTLLHTLFSNTLSLRYFLNASDQVSHPYKTTGKIIVLYILIFKFLDSKILSSYLI